MLKKLFFTLFFTISPINFYTVSGKSMEPTYKACDRVFVLRKRFCRYKIGDVVILKDPRDSKLLMKRIHDIQNNTYFVRGDNPAASTDSRHFGWVSNSALIGKVFFINIPMKQF